MCGLGGDTLAYRTGSHHSGFSYPLLAVALKGLTAASRPLSLIPRLARLRLGPLAAQGSIGTLRHARVFSGSSPSDHIPNIKNDACVRRFNVCGIPTVRGYNAPCFESMVHNFVGSVLMHWDNADRKDRLPIARAIQNETKHFQVVSSNFQVQY